MSDNTLQRHAVVSGGATGIGLAIAAALIEDGLTETIVSRNAERLADACKTLGPKADSHQGDVSLRADCEAAVAAIVAKHGRIDVLVNNAGIMARIRINASLADAERIWDQVHGIDLKGSFMLSFAAVPHLTAPGGRIINIGSVTGTNGGSNPGFYAYSAAKAGVEGMTRAFANDLAARGITVNCVTPGVIADTQMTMGMNSADNPMAKKIPAQRFGHPDEVASAVRWLASPGASYVTGVIVPVNGGQHYR
jgi:3-oxoacyl-[acyl-carrier protein] reductase